MKVVLFCGGLGTRLRDYSDSIPKPLVNIGCRPVLWHLMKYYSSYGHNDFILCLGYKGELIKQYFLNYDECLSNDFIMMKGGKKIKLEKSDIHDWNITFVDTGKNNTIGQRLLLVKELLNNEDVFMANYSDGLTDLDLNQHIKTFYNHKPTASFMSVRSNQSFHNIISDSNNTVRSIKAITESDIWINAGYFIFSNKIFNYIDEGDELVDKPFQRLMQIGKLKTYKHNGFWKPMDTFKDKMEYDELEANGISPWTIEEETNRSQHIIAYKAPRNEIIYNN